MGKRSHQTEDPTDVAGRLGLAFDDTSLLVRAFTHPSWPPEHGGEHYQRLEFLGDAVLGFVIADLLHAAYPDAPEGELTRMRIALVRGRTLAEVARELRLPGALRLGRGAELDGSRHRQSVHEALFEALVGALYLDQGIDTASAFVRSAFGDRIEEAAECRDHDHKSRLQELLHSVDGSHPSYRTADDAPGTYPPSFTSTVTSGDRVLGSGSGASKQAAEQAAAEAALEALDRAR